MKSMDNRIKMVKAMEYIARQLNDESVFETWLVDGVADGDVDFGDLSIKEDDACLFDYYADDDAFSELMDTFLWVMKRAHRSGGLYCDGVVSKGAQV